MIFDIDRIVDDAAYREEMRHRCQTDHLFLGQVLGRGYNQFIEHIHRPAAELYVQKNPNLPIEDQDAIKYRMHLDPRHTFKTTMGVLDSIQWIINFPDITILNETATQPLALAISKSMGEKFYKRKGAAPTIFQMLFPEHVVEKDPESSYNSPARTYEQIDRTIASTSPQSSQSGWHPWIINADDMVDHINSGVDAKPETRQAIINAYNTNKNTLRFGGYIHIRGTRYHPFELYGNKLETMDPAEWKTLIRGAMEVIDGTPLRPGEFPDKENVRLLFPELLSYSSLRTKFFEDYEVYMCQQQNDPSGGHVTTFPEKLYSQSITAPEHVSPIGEVYIAWRLPYAGKDYMAKWAEGAAARIHNGRIYVIDAWRGMYTPTGLGQKIVEICRKHQTGNVEIEDTPGSRFMDPVIRNEALKKNISLNLHWRDFEEDDNQRFGRIRQLEPLMQSGKVLISRSCGQGIELKRQIVHFGLVLENGLIDSISRLAGKIPVSNFREDIEDHEIEIFRRMQAKREWSMVFGEAGRQAAEDAAAAAMQKAAIENMQNGNSYGLPDILGGLDG